MPPNKLYKYRSLEGEAFKYTQAIFARKQFYLAKTSQFNDPFEGKFRFHSDTSNVDLYGKILNSLITKGVSWFMSGRVSDKARLCCFSAKRDDVLMWSHYAASHTGICIEFDTAVEGSPLSDCKKIKYSPHYNVLEENLEGILERACLVKAEQWKYEEEWRLIRESEDFVEFPGKCLTGVILGCRISDDDRQWVLDWLKPYPWASVFAAKEVKNDIRLSIDLIEENTQ